MEEQLNNKGKKEINKQILIMATSVFIIVISTIGVTLAAFVWTDSSEKSQNVVVGNLSLEISPSSDSLGSEIDIPIPDNKVDELKPYTFTLENTGEVDAYYKLKIVDDNQVIASDECADNQIDKSYVGIKVTEGNNIEGVLKDYESSPIDFGILKATEHKKYNVYLWLKEGSPNEIIGKHYHGKIEVETEQTIDNEKTLADAILKDNEVKITEPNFTAKSKDVGLFKLTKDIADAEHPIYYYRGSVKNNYIEFGINTKDVKNNVYNGTIATETQVAQKGSPMLWRIVRINQDESVTLIAENNIGDSGYVWNSINNKSDYLISEEDDTTKDSNIKQTIDNWYKETFVNPESESEYNKKLDKLVLETEFCNDRQGVSSTTSSVASTRVQSIPPEPTLNCAEEKDKVKAKAGLITADEMIYAGALWYTSGAVSGNTTFLNNETWFWTMTPCGDERWVCYWYTFTPGIAGAIVYNSSLEARPVITLSANTSVTTDFLSEYAPGTISNPYKVVIK